MPYDSIFEVGCGAGAFLFPFYNSGNCVAGIDYSENLVKISEKAMPKADFKVCESVNLDLSEKFDVVVSVGVFIYFENYEYAEKTLLKMIKKAKKGIAITDIADLSKKDNAIKEREKKACGDKAYSLKYKNLEHLYYAKEWFYDIFKKEGIDFYTEDQHIKNYFNNPYRFNIFGLL
jgi:2-polyprenyl-3-methyl-5-hydroxy-6-metoxy-1,4-benzoquinol methylase